MNEILLTIMVVLSSPITNDGLDGVSYVFTVTEFKVESMEFCEKAGRQLLKELEPLDTYIPSTYRCSERTVI